MGLPFCLEIGDINLSGEVRFPERERKNIADLVKTPVFPVQGSNFGIRAKNHVYLPLQPFSPGQLGGKRGQISAARNLLPLLAQEGDALRQAQGGAPGQGYSPASVAESPRSSFSIHRVRTSQTLAAWAGEEMVNLLLVQYSPFRFW